jgi:nicotinamidase-related amidase
LIIIDRNASWKIIIDEQKYALLIIDMQNDFVLPGVLTSVPGAHATIPCISRLLDFFHGRNLAVFFVKREYRSNGSDVENIRQDSFLQIGGYAVAGSKGCEIVDELKPDKGDYIVIKRRFSAFMQTELDFILRRLGVTHLVVCGTQYPNCIRTTIFDAVAYGYRVINIVDATSAQTPEIAEANILDIRNIGVECLMLNEFLKRFETFPRKGLSSMDVSTQTTPVVGFSEGKSSDPGEMS